MEGRGTYTFVSGAIYEGDWRGGMKEGKGKYYFKGGSKYVGDFKNDL